MGQALSIDKAMEYAFKDNAVNLGSFEDYDVFNTGYNILKYNSKYVEQFKIAYRNIFNHLKSLDNNYKKTVKLLDFNFNFFNNVRIVYQVYKEELEESLDVNSTRSKLRTVKEKKQILDVVKKTILLIKKFIYKNRLLPIRGSNTAGTRGVNPLLRNPLFISDILKTKINSIWTYAKPNVHIINNYKNSIILNKDLKFKISFVNLYHDFTYDTKEIVIFQVYSENAQYTNTHVSTGILLPKMFNIEPTLVFINADFQNWVGFTEDVEDVIQFGRRLVSEQVFRLFNVSNIIYLPDDLEKTFNVHGRTFNVQQYPNLQRNDDKCFGMGQCQHWTFMAAYVFMKLFAEYGKKYDEGLRPSFKSFLTNVWIELINSSRTVSKYNDLQREIGLLG